MLGLILHLSLLGAILIELQGANKRRPTKSLEFGARIWRVNVSRIDFFETSLICGLLVEIERAARSGPRDTSGCVDREYTITISMVLPALPIDRTVHLRSYTKTPIISYSFRLTRSRSGYNSGLSALL